MAATEQPAATGTDTIEVENPATGEVIRRVPLVGPEAVPGIVAAARAAQPGWEALGYDGRGRILRRAQKWVVDNTDRLVETVVAETRQAPQDALLAEGAYAADAVRVLAPPAAADPGAQTIP